MSGINKVIIVGRLAADPEVKITQGDKTVCTFSLVTSEDWKDKTTGEKQEKAEFHRVVTWNRLAEVCGEYLLKGKRIYLEGSLQTRTWDDKDGNKRYTTEIVGKQMEMLDSQKGQRVNEKPPERQPGQTQIPDDDIPF